LTDETTCDCEFPIPRKTHRSDQFRQLSPDLHRSSTSHQWLDQAEEQETTYLYTFLYDIPKS